LQAVSEEWPHDEHLRRLWFETLAAVTERTARVIRCARRNGQAPPSADPEALAACLMWAFERIMHVALIGDAPGLPGPSLTPSLSQTPGKKTIHGCTCYGWGYCGWLRSSISSSPHGVSTGGGGLVRRVRC